MLSPAILVSLVLGLLARRVGLPPLVGFLVSGFVLFVIGEDGGETLTQLGEVGVYLLLFSIGLKLNLRSLLRREIWGTASIHMAITIGAFGALIQALAAAGFSLFAGMGWENSLLLAFALSFSSTVFAVKVLEDNGQSRSLVGRTSIGILIIQDIFAIAFMTVSTGKVPNAWALLLLGFPLYRWLIIRIMNRAGHAELLILLGVLLAIASADVFAWMDLKPDIAPLLAGIMVGQHPKAKELSDTLMGLKDLFLMLFFVTIGLNGLPSLEGFGIALIFVALMPFKVALFFGLLTRFDMRARTSTFTSLSLANYSEFGLIVGALATGKGWLDGEWLVIIAVSLAITFILAAPLNTSAIRLYEHFGRLLDRFNTAQRLPEEMPVHPGEATALIVGMGRVGCRAYDALQAARPNRVFAIDHDLAVVDAQVAAGRNVVQGDLSDPEFVARMGSESSIELILLATGDIVSSLASMELIRSRRHDEKIAAIAAWPDEAPLLSAAGVDLVFSVYEETGVDFAETAQQTFFPAPSEGA
jgi:predicted Kef-type K+ transport protein